MDEYISRTSIVNKKEINNKTIHIYKTFIKNLYKRYKNEELKKDHSIILLLSSIEINDEGEREIEEDFNFLVEKFEEIILKETKGTIKYICHIFSRTKFDILICKYLPYVISYNEDYHKRRLEDKKENKIDFSNEKNILKVIREKTNDLKYEEIILILLLLLNPPKRLQEYQYCKILDREPLPSDDKNYNYYYNDKIYINICKVDRRTLIQKNNNDFKNISNINPKIKNFINIKHEFLLGKFIGDNKISVIMKNVFIKVFDFKIGIHDLRRMYLTFKDDNGMKRNEREYLSLYMNHNLEEQNKYIYK